MKFVKSLFVLLFLSLTIMVFAQEKLIFAVTLIRHGDRSPYESMNSSKIKYQWPQGIGELTPEGMHQEYLLGSKLRKRYIDTYQLLPESYQANSMFVLSTDCNRTLMSAESFLMGLYPPGTGPNLSNGKAALPHKTQVIPIHITPPGQLNIICPEISDKEQFNYLLKKYSFTQPAWIETNKNLAANFKRWGDILGVDISNLNDFLVPSDNVYCMVVHHIALPKELTKKDKIEIMKMKLYACALRFVPKQMAMFMASGFLTKLDSDIQLAIEEKQPYKYILYSGHDDSILGIMSALGAPLKNNPPYAAHVDFELFKDNSNYIVKIWYNDKFVNLTENKDKSFYTLKEFESIIEPYVKK